MEWSQVINDKSLQNLPYKIELNKWGNIEMTPASNRHGNLQTKIAFHLMNFMKNGTVLTECSVKTSEGVKVADVAWASENFLKKHRGNTPYKEAPEICVEILSFSNTEDEMMTKKNLYFSGGAKEFWICNEDGVISFYIAKGKIKKSELFPDMPLTISAEA
jgi:Uma2 family endonuclease